MTHGFAAICLAGRIGAAWAAAAVSSLIHAEGWRLLLRLPVCLTIPNGILLLCYFRTAEFRLLREVLRVLRRKILRKA